MLSFFLRASLRISQLMFLATPKLPPPVTRVPFFGDKDLLTSASLNGGAVFASFIQMVTEWTRLFDHNVTEEKVYEKIISNAQALLPNGK